MLKYKDLYGTEISFVYKDQYGTAFTVSKITKSVTVHPTLLIWQIKDRVYLRKGEGVSQ